MKRFSVTFVFVLLLSIGAAFAAGEKEGWKVLFDGKSLNGWKVRGGFAEYHVADGAIVGTTVEGSPNTFLCTEEDYGDFELEFEVQVNPALNSGVQIRSHVYEKDTPTFVVRNGKKVERIRKAGDVFGYQVEISGAKSGASGGIWDEARRATWLYDAKENPKASKAFRDNEWNRIRVICVGDRIRTWVNGVACTDARDPLDQSGFIGLQVHSYRGEKPAQVRWRDVRVKDLGVSTWKPLFDGRTLDGWHKRPGGSWKVKDGAIEGSNVGSDPRHGCLVSDRRFGDFTVRVDFKAVQGNSGLYFRVDEVEGAVGVHGFQAEVDAANDVGGLYETGGRAWVIQPKPEQVREWFRPGQWNQMAVSAHGKWIVVHVNGYKTAELKDDPGRTQGHLALQLHGSQDMRVLFKNIEILTPSRPVSQLY